MVTLIVVGNNKKTRSSAWPNSGAHSRGEGRWDAMKQSPRPAPTPCAQTITLTSARPAAIHLCNSKLIGRGTHSENQNNIKYAAVWARLVASDLVDCVCVCCSPPRRPIAVCVCLGVPPLRGGGLRVCVCVCVCQAIKMWFSVSLLKNGLCLSKLNRVCEREEWFVCVWVWSCAS